MIVIMMMIMTVMMVMMGMEGAVIVVVKMVMIVSAKRVGAQLNSLSRMLLLRAGIPTEQPGAD